MDFRYFLALMAGVYNGLDIVIAAENNEKIGDHKGFLFFSKSNDSSFGKLI